MAKNTAFNAVAAIIAVGLFVLGGTAFAVSQKTKAAPIPNIKVLSPNGGETYRAGQKVKIKWQSVGVSRVYLSLLINGGKEVELTPKGVPAKAKQFNWIVSSEPEWVENGYQILIHNKGASKDILDVSDSVFSIVSKVKTAKLKTYKNTQYGFELQYPSTWKVEDRGVGVGIWINPPDFKAPASGTAVPYFSFAVVAHGAAVDEQPVTRVFGARTGYVYAKGNMIFVPRDVDGWYYMTYRPGVKEVGQMLASLKFM